jgi:hypothetical protein
MKKLLLTLTSLALLSTSLYAGCTANVDMGNTNKIINLEAGSNDGDAVNYKQTLKESETNIINQATPLFDDISTMKIYKIGATCLLSGSIQLNSDVAVGTDLFRFPVGYQTLHNGYIEAYETRYRLKDTGFESREAMSAGNWVNLYTLYTCG